MNMICRLFGHKIHKEFTDGGYHVCERCQMHEYWDNKNVMIEIERKFKYSFEDAGLFLKPFWYILKKFNCIKGNIFHKIYFLKYRIRNFFYKSDELPF